MGRAQFEYDEVGNTFYYVLVSFYAVVLFPLTHFLWPFSSEKNQVIDHSGCQCEGDQAKRARKDAIKPWERTKQIVKTVVLIFLWTLFIFLAYKVSQIEHEFVEYDPYKILQLDVDADVTEIKKKYRELSKLYHPDKGGDPETFDGIVKAYKALTDEESRENWRLYGNPDGPKATTFGIALPKWIVSEQYGNWVLGLYALIFMIVLPVAVGLWWYNSMKYSADKVLLETTRLYYYFLQKTPNMEVNRILMVIAGSFEFWKKFNTEIVERETDDIEIPRVMKELRNLGENKKEAPFSHPWSIKARTLIHAYLTKVDLRSDRLITDQRYMVDRSLILMEEFLRVMLQMMLQIPMQRPPSLDSLENALKLFPMFVQALWPRNSSLLQLPHIYEQNIAYLRKNRVANCQDLARLNEHKRRSLLNTVNDDQYKDIIYVLSMMPKLEISAKVEVQGEDDKETVTVGSVVTLKVTLQRSPLLDLEKRKQELEDGFQKSSGVLNDRADDSRADREEEDQGQSTKRKVWEKQPKKKAKKGGKAPQRNAVKKPPVATKIVSNDLANNHVAATESAGNSPNPNQRKLARKERQQQADRDAASDSDSSNSATSLASDNQASDDDEDNANSKDRDQSSNDGGAGKENAGGEEDDDIWDEHADLVKKETLLESEPVTHHEVHCPCYPGEKFEWWYLYLVDRKSRRLVSMVVPCKTLDIEKTVELRFSAPPLKGTYYFTLNVRSDSYLDSDYSIDLKMEVHPPHEPPQVKYEDTEDEDEEKDNSGDSSADYTEGSDSEQEE